MLLPALVFLALAAFATALFGLGGATRASWLHLVLAVGAMPLILGAMIHFVPVLTRTRSAHAALGLIPLLALAGGALAVGARGFPAFGPGPTAGASVALVAALVLLAWTVHRRAAAIGRAHPGLAWYQAALACLIAALVAVLAGALWPGELAALRRAHLHLNTLGFISLTAVSTMAVLLPTAVGRADPQCGARLQRDLPLALGGTLCVALGAAWFAPLAPLGGLLWGVHLARLATAWRPYRRDILALHGAAPALAAALALFAGCLVFGALVPLAARGWVPPVDPVIAFVAGFLPALVSGAASQLLPVWLQPGAPSAWQASVRRRLGRHNGIRAVVFLLAGVAAGLGFDWGPPLAAAALVWFLAQAVSVLAPEFRMKKTG